MEGTKKADLSPVRAKLYTKSGVLKGETECAPNGYYYLPLYDKGEYLIKLEAPPGWLLEPEQQSVSTDPAGPCAQGIDLNFNIVGFALAGRVCTEGSSVGPAGVELLLEGGGSKYKATTIAGGMYTFKDAPPGTYTLTASHPTWKFKTSSTSVTASFSQSEVKETFGVLGYDVTGTVTWEGGEPAGEVPALLIPQDKAPRPSSLSCALSETGKKAGAWCSASSANDGTLLFPSIPFGKYVVVPDAADPSASRFEIANDKLHVTVEHAPASISGSIVLLAFTVSGKVLHANGDGVEAVDVLLDGKKVAVTDGNGAYSIKAKQGMHDIQAKKQHVTFKGLSQYQLTHQLRRIGSIQVEAYDICGQVVMESASAEGRTVTAKGTSYKAVTDKEGKFCLLAPPGDYTLSCDSDGSALITPPSLPVSTASRPFLTARFAQAALHVRGQVTCEGGTCEGVTVTVSPTSGGAARTTTPGKGGKYKVDDVAPGEYEVKVSRDGTCWAETARKVKVGKEDSMNVNFEQKGLKVALRGVTAALKDLDLKHDNGPTRLSLKPGQTEVCVPASGKYTVVSPPCVQLTDASFSVPSASPINLAPARYGVVVRVTASVEVPELRVGLIRRQQDGSVGKEEVAVALSKQENTRGGGVKLVYEGKVWAEEGSSLEFAGKAAGGDVLFVPATASYQVTGAGQCPEPSVVLTAKKGVVLVGVISPAIAGVEVRAVEVGGETVAAVTTGEDGSYKIGPLWDDRKYALEAVKEGYSFKQDDQGQLKSIRMAELKVKVTDSFGGRLAGVLLSLSGEGNFRQNNKTNEHGDYTFTGLEPGTYFLRPILKEYEFSPASHSVTVQEGKNPDLKVSGTRVAFSAHGIVSLLDRLPEKGALIQAQALDGSEGYEDTVSDADGVFRLRGLKAGVSYQVSCKTQGPQARHERCTPDKEVIKMGARDTGGLAFTAFRKPPALDLVGRVTSAAPAEHLSKVTVEVSKASNPGDVFVRSSLLLGDYFEFPALARDTYILKAVAALDSRAFNVTSKPLTVTLDDNFNGASLFLSVEPRGGSDGLGSTSFWVLVLMVAAWACWEYRKELATYMKEGGASSDPSAGAKAAVEKAPAKKSKKT